MGDREEILFSVLLMMEQVSEQLSLLGSVFDDFSSLSEAMSSYCADFADRAKIDLQRFSGYKKSVINEANA